MQNEQLNITIFTEAINCAPVLKKALETFYKFHPNYCVNIIATQKDIDELGEIQHHKNNKFIILNNDSDIVKKFNLGHLGTAEAFALMFNPDADIDEYIRKEIKNYVIHFDSDVVFKKESISLIVDKFNEGYDIVGSRRCYKNNPSNVPGLDNYPDTISTYFFGMNINSIPKYPQNTFVAMCQGIYNPIGWPVLDFFDPVVHCALNSGASIFYLDNNLVGDQNELGKKINSYKANLHLDCGSHLIHFGGAGSGCSVFYKKSAPEEIYKQWGLVRYFLYLKIVYHNQIRFENFKETIYDNDGRWIDGQFNDEIINQIYVGLAV